MSKQNVDNLPDWAFAWLKEKREKILYNLLDNPENPTHDDIIRIYLHESTKDSIVLTLASFRTLHILDYEETSLGMLPIPNDLLLILLQRNLQFIPELVKFLDDLSSETAQTEAEVFEQFTPALIGQLRAAIKENEQIKKWSIPPRN